VALGAVLVEVCVVVVSVLDGVVVVAVVVVVVVGAEDAGVEVVPAGGVLPLDGSAASAPLGIGPPNPAAVKPPPASAERITRRTLKGTGTLKRAAFTSDMLGPCSS
jgi:hypothetical protein